MELLDIVDENNIPTGKSEDRKVVHRKGYYHREVGAWIVNKNNEILIQKRSANKEGNPNKWSLTAGHVDSGEDVKEAMIREIKEEVGIDVKLEDLELLFISKHNSLTGSNNVFGYLYLVRIDKKIEDFTIQEEEVSELKYISIEELEKIVKSKDENYTFPKWERVEEMVKRLKESI